MSLDQYDIKSQENRWNEEYGVEEWVLVFAIPNNRVQAEQISFRVSMANLLPGCDQSDVYAPCIVGSSLAPDPEDANGQLLHVTYRRPTVSMILQPGRALMTFDTYETTKTKEGADWTEGYDVAKQLAGSRATIGGWTNRLQKYEYFELDERGTINIRCADWAAKELDLFTRAFSWIGYGGDFTINGVRFNSLKCSRVTIGRREEDVSVVESTWVFARKPDGWRFSGDRLLGVYAVDMHGEQVTYNYATRTATDADGKVLRAGEFMAVSLRDNDPDVIKGLMDFSPIEDYFKWIQK